MASIRKAFATADDQFFFDFEDAWMHQHEILYPDVKLLDAAGNYTENVLDVAGFIVGGTLDAKFVNEFTEYMWGLSVQDASCACEGSVIITDDDGDICCFRRSDFELYDGVRALLDEYAYSSDIRGHLGI